MAQTLPTNNYKIKIITKENKMMKQNPLRCDYAVQIVEIHKMRSIIYILFALSALAYTFIVTDCASQTKPTSK